MNQKSTYRVNLVRLQLLCEINYFKLCRLLPNLAIQDQHRVLVQHHEKHSASTLQIDVLQRSPYTTLLHLLMRHDGFDVGTILDTEVRLYHDVQMAEVVFRRPSQRLEPHYPYPNPDMHQPDEKEQRNRFLEHWLDYCYSGGLAAQPIAIG